MRRLFAIGLILLSIAARAVAADPPTLQVDRDTLYEGESVTLTVRVPDAGDESTPDLSKLQDAQTRFLGKQNENRYQVVIENGRMRREGFSGTIYQFSVQPGRIGSYPGGTITVKAGGRTSTLDFPRLTILEIPRQDAALLELVADRQEVLPDEKFTVTLRLQVRRLDPPYADITPFHPDDPPALVLPHLTGKPIEGLEVPEIRSVLQAWRQRGGSPGVVIDSAPEDADPFNMGNFFNMGDPFGGRSRSLYLPPGKTIDANGIPFSEFLFPVTFTAREEGLYTFGPASLKGRLLTGVDNNRRALTRDLYAVARALTVRVVPPPEKGRPLTYFGLSGSNLTADAQLSASACQVGDPLKLTLSVRGPLNWQRAVAPDLSAISNLSARFRIYGSTMQTLKAGDGRDYTFTLRPLQPGTEEIPSLPVSWFDTVAHAYRTVYTTPIPLKVDPSAELTSGAWADPMHTETTEQESASAAKAPAALRIQPPQTDRPDSSWTWWLLAGPLLFGLRLSGGELRRRLAVRRQSARPRQALARALNALKRIKPGDPRRSAETAGVVLRTFAADWLNREPGGLTAPDWIRLLQDHGTPAGTAEEFGDRMTRLAEAAYSPVPRPEVETDILPRLPDLLRRLVSPENGGNINRSATHTLTILLAIGSVLGSNAVAQEPWPDRRSFEWEEAQSLAAKATTPAAFREAATRYERLADGRRDGEVFYNLGTCLLLAGEPGPALKALIRAERYWGRPADLAHNMALARTALNGGEPQPEPWDRTLLFFHFGLPLAARIQIATTAFSLFWILWALAWNRVRGVVKLALTLALLTAALFGTSALLTHYQENQEESALPAPTGVNHEPS